MERNRIITREAGSVINLDIDDFEEYNIHTQLGHFVHIRIFQSYDGVFGMGFILKSCILWSMFEGTLPTL